VEQCSSSGRAGRREARTQGAPIAVSYRRDRGRRIAAIQSDSGGTASASPSPPTPIPPFECFYETHKGEVLALLRRRAGRERADDLFQETFLRALRAYDRLEHGEHLRAWVLTIAANCAIDGARRERPAAELTAEPSVEDARPPFEELAQITADLPPKERAAVVLRYGYDLGYDQIGAALGSNEQAARQAASAGVRRLRKEKDSR
jgi:RNA polymerase sigma factor (sigma-70 family)